MELPSTRELELETTLRQRNKQVQALTDEVKRLRVHITQQPPVSEDETMAIPPSLFALLIPHINNAAQAKPVSGSSTVTSALASKLQLLQQENDELYEQLKVGETGKLKEEVRALHRAVKKLEDSLRESHSVVVNLHAELDQTHEIFANMSSRSLSPILNLPTTNEPSHSPTSNGVSKVPPTGPRAGVPPRGGPIQLRGNKRQRMSGNMGNHKNIQWNNQHTNNSNPHISPAMSTVSLPRQMAPPAPIRKPSSQPGSVSARDEVIPKGPPASWNNEHRPSASSQDTHSRREARQMDTSVEPRERREDDRSQRGREERSSVPLKERETHRESLEPRKERSASRKEHSAPRKERSVPCEERSASRQGEYTIPRDERPSRREREKSDSHSARGPNDHGHDRQRSSRAESPNSRQQSHRKRPHSPSNERHHEKEREREQERNREWSEKDREPDRHSRNPQPKENERESGRKRDGGRHEKEPDRRERGHGTTRGSADRDWSNSGGGGGDGGRRNRPSGGPSASNPKTGGDRAQSLIERMSL